MSGQPYGNTSPLVHPLTTAHIDAAARLGAALTQWTAAEEAFTTLARSLPGFGPSETLLKAVVVNALFGTNVYAIMRMAEHVREVLDQNAHTDDVDLVERMALLPPARAGGRQRRYTSFASKFCHFFVDGERFPIYDDYTYKMVRWHLGRGNLHRDPDHPYREHVTNFNRLRGTLPAVVSVRALDRYLWLAGLYRAWRKDPDAPISVEVAQLFKTHIPQQAEDLRLLASAAHG